MVRGAGRRGLYPVVRDLSWKALSLGLERGSRLVVTIASASLLGEAAFGTFVFASTSTAILALAADLGLGLWTTRALARGDAGAPVITVGLALRCAALVPYAFGLTLLAAFASSHEARSALVLLGVAAAASSFSDHFGAIFRGSGRFADETRLNAVRAVLTAGAGIVALVFDPTLGALAAALALAGAGTFGLGLVGVLRLHTRARFDSALARAALREAWPIWLAGLLSMLYFKLDTFFVRSYAGDVELGAYGAAYKIFEGAMLLPAVLLAATFPRLARLRESPDLQRRLENRLGLALLGLGALVGTASYFGRTLFVTVLFGASFGRAADSLRVLALGMPLVYVNFGLTHFLIARGRERTNLWLALLMLTLTLGLDRALIPARSGPGAALATVLAELALTGGCLRALASGGGAVRSPRAARAASRRDRTPA